MLTPEQMIKVLTGWIWETDPDVDLLVREREKISSRAAVLRKCQSYVDALRQARVDWLRANLCAKCGGTREEE